jgi:hypothetical protein
VYQLTLGHKYPAATVPANQEQFITPRQIWNWLDNARGAVTELQGRRTEAQALQSGLASSYSQWPALPNEGSLSGLDAIVVSYYNGTGGLPNSDKRINGSKRRTPWKTREAGQEKTWVFYQNSQNYVQSVNLRINIIKPWRIQTVSEYLVGNSFHLVGCMF